MKTMTETLRELHPMRFSQLVEQFADVRAQIAEKRKVRAIKTENRPKCVVCGETVGRCVMVNIVANREAFLEKAGL